MNSWRRVARTQIDLGLHDSPPFCHSAEVPHPASRPSPSASHSKCLCALSVLSFHPSNHCFSRSIGPGLLCVQASIRAMLLPQPLHNSFSLSAYGEQMARCFGFRGTIVYLILLSAFAASAITRAQENPGAAVYAKRCAFCHDKTAVRMPTRSVLQQRSASGPSSSQLASRRGREVGCGTAEKSGARKGFASCREITDCGTTRRSVPAGSGRGLRRRDLFGASSTPSSRSISRLSDRAASEMSESSASSASS